MTAETVAAATTPQAEPAPEAGASTPVAATPSTAPSEPAAPEAAPAAAARHVAIEAVEIEAARMYVAGAAEPGAIVRVYRDGARLGDTVAGPTGRWLLQADAPEPGRMVLRVDDLAGDGSVRARAEVAYVHEVTAEEGSAAAERAEEGAVDPAAPVPATASSEPAPAPAGTAPAPADTVSAPASTQAPETVVSAAAPSAATAGEPPLLPAGRVIIRRGDNLWTLSRRVYGRGTRYTTIFDANRGQIRDPGLIFPGQVFDLPRPDPVWGAVPGVEALENRATGN